MLAFVDEATEFLISAGYERRNIVRNCRYTAPSSDGSLLSQSIELAAFSESPHDMSTACIAAFESGSGYQETLTRLRYLNSPVALIGHKDKIELWPIGKSVAKGPFDVYDRSNWLSRIKSRVSDFSPQSIAAAKNDRIQLDFVDAGLGPWTTNVTSASLKLLLEELLHECLSSLPASTKHRVPAKDAVLRMVFHLFTCRVLEDKGVIDAKPNARAALQAANQKFSKNVSPKVLDSPFVSKQATDKVFDILRKKFSFATLTTDVLSHSYENALVSKSMRRKLGIHYTPSKLADYILRRLPIESIPESSRVVWDPCCGCGSFLLSAFNRLNDLLPTTYNGKQRHKYLVSRLIGSDVDGFACELAALALVLMDLHNDNGWTIRELDMMESPASSFPKNPNIIVTNLPFREIKEGIGQRRELSAEILGRILDHSRPGALMGIVLPQSFMDSRAAANTRRKVLEMCDVLEIGMFPGGLFESASETAVLLLQRRKSAKNSVSLATVRELRSADYQGFMRTGAFTRTYPVDVADWKDDASSRFRVSPLANLWKRLETLHLGLSKVADVRNGLQLKTDDTTSVSERKRSKADRPFIDRLDALRPFALLVGDDLAPSKWVKYGENLHRQRTVDIFDSPKVLINSNRNPGSAWRLIAAPSRDTLYFSDNFHAVIPTSNTTVEQLTAILNSPIANAWFDSRCRKRKVVQATLESLPVPVFDPVLGREISETVKKMEAAVVGKWKKQAEGMFYDGLIETGDTAKLLLELDQLVYDAYGLSRDERRHVDSLMATDQRPG